MRTLAAVGALCMVASGVVMTGCASSSTDSPTSAAPLTRTRTVTGTRTITPPPPTFTASSARTVAPLAPGTRPVRGEIERNCPYIASTPDQSPTINVADIDGGHVYRTTVLTPLRPVGCRFYFYAPPYEAITDIVPRRFASAKDAYNAMVITAKAGQQAAGKPDLVPGVDAVLYRTRFFGPDGARDWACVFADGRTMVIVHTQRSDTSLNALLIARAVARKL